MPHRATGRESAEFAASLSRIDPFSSGPRGAHSGSIDTRPVPPGAAMQNKIGKIMRDMGPLMLIAILVPGGTLIAAAIYFFQRRNGG
jgi:hypothetical protein